MIINKELIKEFKPCEDRYTNYLLHYSEFNGSIEEFIDLENISYNDKTWLAKRVLNKNQLIKWGILSAESVQYIYNEKYPNDVRISNLFKYLNNIIDFTNLSKDQLNEISLLRESDAAAYAAAYAVDAAAYAVDAAAYTNVNAAKTNRRKIQEDLNLSFLKQVSKL